MANDVFKKAKTATASVTKKATDRLEVGKINGKIVDLQKEINNLYQQIGKTVYETKDYNREKNGEQIALLNEKQATLEELRQKSAALRGMVICPSCKQERPATDVFCAVCGAKLETEENALLGEEKAPEKE